MVIGPKGPSGDAGGLTITRIARETVGGNRAVKLSTDGDVLYANPADVDVGATVGLTTHAALEGAAVSIQIAGEMVEESWAWTPGAAIYLADSGVLTQLVPAAYAILRIGTATSATSILIDPSLIAKIEGA
jgi:hypothetical protein